jgi:hypothetical protein
LAALAAFAFVRNRTWSRALSGRGFGMKAVERVMKAYLSTRKLSVEQTDLVRAQLTKFIDELLAKTPEPPKS